MKGTSSKTSAQMHSDHQQWLSEDALWRDELRLWQVDTEQAQAEIEKIRQAIARHKTVLESYGGSLCLTEDALAAHEHALAGSQQGRVMLDEKASKVVHGQEINRQNDRRHRHQELRSQHYRFMALLRLLSKALSE